MLERHAPRHEVLGVGARRAARGQRADRSGRRLVAFVAAVVRVGSDVAEVVVDSGRRGVQRVLDERVLHFAEAALCLFALHTKLGIGDVRLCVCVHMQIRRPKRTPAAGRGDAAVRWIRFVHLQDAVLAARRAKESAAGCAH